MSSAEDIAIDALAGAVGIEPSYRDTNGRVQRVPVESKRAVLSSMGFDLSSLNTVRETLQAREVAEWHLLVGPVTVLRRSPDIMPCVTVTVPEALLSRSLDWRLEPEAGAMLSGRSLPRDLAKLERHSVGGSSFVRVGLPLPMDLADGYHRLTVALAHIEMATTLISTEATAFVPDWLARGERRWGIACPLFSLWSDTSCGIGDFSDLATLVRIARELGASVVGLNPLHAPLPGEHADPSPYLPSSRLFLDPTYIDVTRVAAGADRHAAPHLAQERGGGLVDYPLVRRFKHAALETLYRSRQWHVPPMALQAFRRKHGASLTRFAVFNALHEQFGPAPWHRWPSEVRGPEAGGIAAFVQAHGDRIDFHIWLQWIADQQLAAATDETIVDEEQTRLYRDLAVGVHPDGADAWADQTMYVTGASVGAPPDAFNPVGQDWGTPPQNPLALSANGYVPFIAALRANMRHAHVLRIDHVMGLQRMYWVPSGLPAASGAYVRYPFDDMLGILALESRRNRCMIVGEDLGTLPEGFHERMADTRILSYRLMMFERYPDGLFHRPATYPRLAVASSGTHDLPPIRSWWEGSDIELRLALGLCSACDAGQQRQDRQHDRAMLLAALRDQGLVAPDMSALQELDLPALTGLLVAIQQFLARTPSALMITNLSDVLAETAQINVPGTVAEHPNWRHRFRLPVSALAADPLVRHIALAVAVERGKRAEPPA